MSDVDLADALSEHAANFPVDAVDSRSSERLVANLIDVIAVTLGGVHADGLDAVQRFARSTSGVGPSVVIGTTDSLSAPGAALANATAGHALEFDDALDEGGGMHAGVPVHSAALAVADPLGGVSGPEYIAATAVGLDVSVRLALATTEDFGWHRASVFSVFGATIAATRLLRLDATRTRDALGLAFSQASATRQSLFDGALSTRVHTGFAARNAVTAALLAAEGVTGATNIFEGANGFFPVFQRGGYLREVITDGLGSTLSSSRISEKPYPGGRSTHAFVEAALALYANRATSQPIEQVRVHVPADLVAFIATQHSYPVGWQATYDFKYAVALALTTGTAPLTAFVHPESVDPLVRGLYDRITVVDEVGPGDGGVLQVIDHDGVTSVDVGVATGRPDNPLSRPALIAKFWECFEFAGQPVEHKAASKALSLLESLPSVTSTREITTLLAGS